MAKLLEIRIFQDYGQALITEYNPKKNQMADKIISGSTATRAQADSLIAELKKADFSASDISIQFPDRQAFKNQKPVEKQSGLSKGVITGVTLCGAIGLVLGWLAGAGTLIIPGTAAIAAEGPSVAALIFALVGLVLGGFCAWIIVFSNPDHGSRFVCRNEVVSGNIIVSVRTDDTAKFVRASNIFAKPADVTNPPKR